MSRRKEGDIRTHKHREETNKKEAHEATGAEVRVMVLWSAEHPGWPAAARGSGRGKNKFSLEVPERSSPVNTLITGL